MKIILNHLKKYPLLEKAFVYVFKNNKGENNPYHNNNHLMTVFYFSMEMAEYYMLSDVKKVTLGLVALFHDFDHNGKIGNDDVNLIEALRGFYDFYRSIEEYEDELYNVRADDIDTDLFKKLLSHTEFPARPIPTTIEEEIIMDSDMLSNHISGWFKDTLVGLSKEFGISIEEQLPNHIKFVESLTFYTKYAQDLHLEKKDKLLDKLCYLNSIFNN